MVVRRAINSLMTPRLLYFTVFPLVWIVCWLLVAGVSFETQPLVVGDEQQILSQAWYMWRESMFLFPWPGEIQAGTRYPMMLWMINLGWAVFEVSDWWPHIVGYVSGILSVFLTAGLARVLWPGWVGLGAMSGTALSGFLAWMAFAGFPGPEMLASVFVITAVYALVWTWRTGRRDGFLYYGLAMAACVLTIGPLAWGICLPVAFLAPVWGGALAEQIDDDRTPPHGWQRWYMWLLAGSGLSAAVIVGWFGWALLAEQTTVEILLEHYWSPLAGLYANENATGRPWWHLMIIFVGMTVPWVLWPAAWRSLTGVLHLLTDGGARLAIIWMISVLAPVLLVPDISWNQLLPALPAVALLIAFLVFCRADKEADVLSGARGGESALGLFLVVSGAVLIVLPFAGTVFQIPWWADQIAGSWGVLLILLGVAIAYAMPTLVDLRMMIVSVVASLVVVVGFLVAEPLGRDFFDARPPARFVSEQLEQGSAVAFAGTYHGEFDFAARLDKPIAVLDPDDPIGTAAWLAGNPGAVIAQPVSVLPPASSDDIQVLAHFAYGTRYMVFWSGESIMANPALLNAPAP